MRGMFTCGVLDVLMEQGITFDGTIGVSAGAVFGCNFKSRQIGRAIRYNKKYCNDKRYVSFGNLLRTGDLYGADFCYRTLPTELDPFDRAAFRANPMEFYVVATDMETGKAVYHKCMDGGINDIEWMRASASMPLISNIVEIGDYKLCDGGVADSIPVRGFEQLGFNHNVVILTQPLGFVKKFNKLLGAAILRYPKYHKLWEALANRHVKYNATTAYIRQQELSGKLFVIRPEEPLRIGNIERDPRELARVYRLGRETMIDRLEELKEYMRQF